MLRLFRWSLGLLPFLVACAGSDGHPPVADETPAGGSSGGPAMNNTSGKGSTASSTSLLDGGFIKIPQVSDIALDEPRGVLYVSTTDGGLAIVDLATSKISSQMVGKGGLTGMDLSPDGNLLAIGEHSTDQDTQEFWVHVLDLEASTMREIRLPIEHMHLVDGSQSVVFANDSSLLVSASWAAIGQTPMFRIDLRDNSSEPFGVALSDTMFARSGDGSVVYYVEPVHTDGSFGEYDVGTEMVTLGVAGIALRDVSVNASGSQVGMPSLGLFSMWQPDADGFSEIGAVLLDGRDAMASVFSPVRDSVYVAWSKSVIDEKAPFIARYTADASLDPEGVVTSNVALAAKRESGYTPARMKISSDGTLLFVTVESGINVYLLEP